MSKKVVTTHQDQDVCLVALLVLLLLTLSNYLTVTLMIRLSIPIILIALLIPQLIRPITISWFWIGETLSKLTSRLFLSVLFFIVVTPIGVIRRFLSKGAIYQSCQPNIQSSNFINTTKTITYDHLSTPF